MNFYSLTFLQAQAGAQGGGSGLTMLLMLALIFVVMWLFMIRPQQKRQKELNSLKKGDKVVTVGGIYGTVIEVNDNKVMLEIDKDVRIKVDKASLVKDFSDAQQA